MYDDPNDYDAYIDSVLYSDQSADNYTPYGANGYGRLILNVVSILNGKETDVYEGTDEKEAERKAINAFERSHRKAEVLVMRDGGSWKWVFCPPRKVQGAKPSLVEAGCCTDPRCGEINPLYCWCRYSMTPEEIERYKQHA